MFFSAREVIPVNAYTYRWSLRPDTGLSIELSVTAPSLVVARREIRRFLVAHDGDTWTVRHVSRETTVVAQTPLTLPRRRWTALA